ncbi:hypothetical protein MNBD_PLANCTO02-3359 [hydrothermal vent metagenome]|uniref:TNase-like domain-containing protein n=1 Tax=hydrothermal vent metagenome TaxID=652676 RepID=A0A3B1DD13_9ZZZZ
MSPWRMTARFFSRTTVTVVLLLGFFILLRLFREPERSLDFPFDSKQTYYVQRVVDGDTVLLDDGTRVRLLGVDTLETKHPTKPVHPLGVLAAYYTRKHVEGKNVRLQFDRERRDRYNRVLAYLFIDGWFLNEELIREGYSKAEIKYPYSNIMKKRFLKAEAEAREQQKGIWNDKWKGTIENFSG